MGAFSRIKEEGCQIVYDILRNRLSLPEEECTYELATDIFDAVVESTVIRNFDCAKALKVYEDNLDYNIEVLRDLYEDSPDNKYILGYFNGVHGCKTSLNSIKTLTGLDGGDL